LLENSVEFWAKKQYRKVARGLTTGFISIQGTDGPKRGGKAGTGSRGARTITIPGVKEMVWKAQSTEIWRI
jgi:hypothetical protein